MTGFVVQVHICYNTVLIVKRQDLNNMHVNMTLECKKSLTSLFVEGFNQFTTSL